MVDEFNRQSISANLDKRILNSYSDEREDATMAYKTMPAHIYVIATVGLYFTSIFGAILISDIATVFQFMIPIGNMNIAFIIPGALYYKADAKFHTVLE